MVYRVVQPWGKDRAREATLISEHTSAANAFDAIEQMAAQIIQSGGRLDGIELIVVSDVGQIVMRRGVQ